jgi:hypothetical protein
VGSSYAILSEVVQQMFNHRHKLITQLWNYIPMYADEHPKIAQIWADVFFLSHGPEGEFIVKKKSTFYKCLSLFVRFQANNISVTTAESLQAVQNRVSVFQSSRLFICNQKLEAFRERQT